MVRWVLIGAAILAALEAGLVLWAVTTARFSIQTEQKDPCGGSGPYMHDNLRAPAWGLALGIGWFLVAVRPTVPGGTAAKVASIVLCGLVAGTGLVCAVLAASVGPCYIH
jgi:hypothetical protein